MDTAILTQETIVPEQPTAPVAQPAQQLPDKKAKPEDRYLSDMIALPPLGEAGGIAFTQVYGFEKLPDGTQQSFQINITGRGFTASQALENLLDSIRLAKYYHLSVYPPQLPSAPKPKTDAAPAVPGQFTKAPAPVPTAKQPAAVGQNTTSAQGGTILVNKLTVTPRTDGKVKVDFWSAGRKYADISLVAMIDQALSDLSPVAEFPVEAMGKAGEYALNCKVDWVPSENLTSKGNPYKDIVRIYPV